MYIVKTAPALQGLRLAAGASWRQARSLQEISVVWLRQSAAHNGQSPAPSKTPSMLRQGRKAPGPLEIYKYLPDSLYLLQLRKLTADYLQTASCDMVKAEVDQLGGGVCRGRVATAAHRIPGQALSPGSAKH